MKYYITIFILITSKFFCSQEEKISFLKYGIISISSDLTLDDALWEVSLFTKDSIISIKKKSFSNKESLTFNINEKIYPISILEELSLISIKKNGKILYKNKPKLNYNNSNKYVLLRHEIKNKEHFKGNIIDSYKIICEEKIFYVVRSSIKDFYDYWYLINDDKVINIHSEKKYNQPISMGKIILSDLDENQVPEVNFFYKTEKKIKMIHLNNDEKIISSKKGKKLNIIGEINKFGREIYEGFFYYNLNKISE